MGQKTLLGWLLITVAAFCLAGCAAAHYQQRAPGRVTLYLTAPGAEKVEFVSSINTFSPHPASRIKGSRWAVTVATGMLGYVPVIGEGLRSLARGGTEVSGDTLLMFYALHTAYVPIAVLLLIGSIPAFIGLIVVLPVLGHATWHFYRRAVKL